MPISTESWSSSCGGIVKFKNRGYMLKKLFIIFSVLISQIHASGPGPAPASDGKEVKTRQEIDSEVQDVIDDMLDQIETPLQHLCIEQFCDHLETMISESNGENFDAIVNELEKTFKCFPEQIKNSIIAKFCTSYTKDIRWSQTLKKHEDNISCITFSRDSRYLITGSWDGTICLWKGDTQDIFTLVDVYQPKKWPTHIVFNSDNSEIAIGFNDGTIHILEKTEEELLVFKQKFQSQYRSIRLAYHQNNNELISTIESIIYIWQRQQNGLFKCTQILDSGDDTNLRYIFFHIPQYNADFSEFSVKSINDHHQNLIWKCKKESNNLYKLYEETQTIPTKINLNANTHNPDGRLHAYSIGHAIYVGHIAWQSIDLRANAILRCLKACNVPAEKEKLYQELHQLFLSMIFFRALIHSHSFDDVYALSQSAVIPDEIQMNQLHEFQQDIWKQLLLIINYKLSLLHNNQHKDAKELKEGKESDGKNQISPYDPDQVVEIWDCGDGQQVRYHFNPRTEAHLGSAAAAEAP